MINKLLLVRKAYVKADLLDKAKLSQFVSGEPIKVLPLSWSEEEEPSHYGYIFKNINLEAKKALVEFDQKTDGTSLLDLDSDISDTLGAHGLKVHPLS